MQGRGSPRPVVLHLILNPNFFAQRKRRTKGSRKGAVRGGCYRENVHYINYGEPVPRKVVASWEETILLDSQTAIHQTFI